MVITYSITEIDNGGGKNAFRSVPIGEALIYGKSLQEIWSNAAALLGSNNLYYAYIGGDAAVTVTEANAQMRMPACRVRSIFGNNSTHATDYTITLRKNGADTTLTTGLVEAIANHFRETGSGPIDFADGDLAALEIDMAVGGAGSTFRGLWLELEMMVVD